MGVFTKSKSAAGLKEAQESFEAGARVWLARYWDEVMSYQGTGTIAGASDFIADVEAIGWRLEHLSYSWVPEKHRGVTILMFRR